MRVVQPVLSIVSKVGKAAQAQCRSWGVNCGGSGSFPVSTVNGGSFLPEGSVEGLDGSILDEVGGGGGDESRVFSVAFCEDPILKRIPKGARLMAGSVLENVLSRITDDPDDLSSWGRLFMYPNCLAKPQRGGFGET